MIPRRGPFGIYNPSRMRKTKIQTRKKRTLARFTIRKIANRNPRSARTFQRIKNRLARATAGLLLFALLVSGMLIGDSEQLRSEVRRSSGEFTCTATDILSDFNELNATYVTLDRNFPKLFEGLSFCDNGDCAAEKKMYQTEKQIWQLEHDIIALIDTKRTAFKEFKKQVSTLEDEVFFCEDEASCSQAEATLRAARLCEKEFQGINQVIKVQNYIIGKYEVVNMDNKSYPTSIYVKKLMSDFFKNYGKASDSETAYGKCIQAADASVCQKHVENWREAMSKKSALVQELVSLKIDLNNDLKKIDADITALQLGKTDTSNFTAQQGKGWCKSEVQNSKAELSQKISQSAELKKTYDQALADLRGRKAELTAALAAEAEAAAMHAAATKARSIQKQQVEIILSIWTAIRNTF